MDDAVFTARGFDQPQACCTNCDYATAGRAHLVPDAVSGEQHVGRFGWKAQVSSLLHFAGDAYLNEMGITSPFFPEENCPQGDCSLLRCDWM